MSMKKKLCNELFHESPKPWWALWAWRRSSAMSFFMKTLNPKPWRAYEHEEEALAWLGDQGAQEIVKYTRSYTKSLWNIQGADKELWKDSSVKPQFCVQLKKRFPHKPKSKSKSYVKLGKIGPHIIADTHYRGSWSDHFICKCL